MAVITNTMTILDVQLIDALEWNSSMTRNSVLEYDEEF